MRVTANNGVDINIRALIDQGSQSCFINQNVIKKLKALRKPTYVTIEGIGSIKTKRINRYAELQIRGQFAESPVVYIKALS